jgi:hypothetical protein
MVELRNSPQAIAAVVASATSLATLLLTLTTKNFVEKRLLIFKLNTEHEFEQRKKIKNVLAANKTHLLTACENLNRRLWNFGKPEHFRWMDVNGQFAERGTIAITRSHTASSLYMLAYISNLPPDFRTRR